MRKLVVAAGLFAAMSSPLVAQTGALKFVRPIAILNQEALYSESLFGQRVQSNLAEKSNVLATENRTIESELQAEELALTELRPELEAADFRTRADAFDVKVEGIRKRQSEKAVEIDAWVLAERQRFFQAALPVLVTLTGELGAAVVLDSRTVVLATENIDITQVAIARVNEKLGDGAPADQ